MSQRIKAAIYARVSTDIQVQGSGLSVQIAECKQYAEEIGYEVVNVFKDEGISGARWANERQGLQQMLTAARQKEFSVLLVHDNDRLARDVGVGVNIIGLLAEAGLRLIDVRSRTPFEDVGALLGLVKLWSAGEDRKKILERTKNGHIRRAKEGKIAGPPPLGYDKTSEGRLAINQEEAELVRRIYRML